MNESEMQYRQDKHGDRLSILGFGCMRFLKKGNNIDLEEAEREIMEAYNAGVNYFDTAYVYSGSEAAIGEIFEKNGIRDKINIATKLPQYLVSNNAALDRYFNEELSRLRTDHVDYYLMHHLTDVAMWEKLKDVGVLDWIKEKKASGQIRNIGFSYHGTTDGFLKILNDYDWDMCQIQYNFMDINNQAGTKGLELAGSKGIPVVIMEGLLGGRLANAPDNVQALYDAFPVKRSPVEWAFRWLCNHPEVAVVLSGCNEAEQIDENLRIFDTVDTGIMSAEELKLMDDIRAAYISRTKIGCTGCRYCMPCPNGDQAPSSHRAGKERRPGFRK